MSIGGSVSARIWTALIILAGLGVAFLAGFVLPRYADRVGLVVIPLLLLVIVGLIAMLLIPSHALPATALVLFAVVPPRLLPQDGPLGALPITTIVLVIWAIRRIVAPGDRPASQPLPRSGFRIASAVLAVLFIAWSISVLVRSIDVQTSVGWLTSFSAGALLVCFVKNCRPEAELVQKTWLVLSGALGAYAVLEAALRTNPIWGTVYSVLGLTSSQHWSTYRSEASFGHPLFAALFFAVGCALGVGIWLSNGSRRVLVATAASGLGVVATVSRGALLGLVIAVAFAILVSLVLRGEKRLWRYGALAVGGSIAVLIATQFGSFAERNDSTEAGLSSQARDIGLYVAFRAAEMSGFVGSGPGTSGISGRMIYDVVIENSGLQLLISVGIPGLVLFILLVAFAIVTAWRRGAVGPAAGLVAYAIGITGFNALDALRPMHILLGCLLLMALNLHVPVRERGISPIITAPAARFLDGSRSAPALRAG